MSRAHARLAHALVARCRLAARHQRCRCWLSHHAEGSPLPRREQWARLGSSLESLTPRPGIRDYRRKAVVQPSDDVGEEPQSDLHTRTIPRCRRGHSGLCHALADGFEAGDEACQRATPPKPLWPKNAAAAMDQFDCPMGKAGSPAPPGSVLPAV